MSNDFCMDIDRDCPHIVTMRKQLEMSDAALTEATENIVQMRDQIATLTRQRDLAVEALEWACGEKPNDEGKWFDAPDGAPKYWWRTELRKAMSAITDAATPQ